MWSTLILVSAILVTIGGLLGAFASYKASQQNDEQQQLIEELQKSTLSKANELIGLETGGDSYPKFTLLRNTPAPGSNLTIGFYFTFRIEGKFSLKKFKVRIVDIKDFTKQSSAVYHTDLWMLDLNFPTPFASTGMNHPNLVYGKDYDEIKPNTNEVLPDEKYESPNPKIKVGYAIALDEDLPKQGFNIYCQSEHKFWFYEIRFITKGEKTEWAIQQREFSENNDWKLLDSESEISKGYDLLDENGNPIFYGE